MANVIGKMQSDTPMSSRIPDIHDGSSLISGGASRGKSNGCRWIIRNGWLEATVALLLNLLYNAVIATYVWVIRSRKREHRKRKSLLIDVPKRNTPLHRNLGTKNAALQRKITAN